MILIAAFMYREAEAIARKRELGPREWRFIMDKGVLFGRRNPKVLQAACWYDEGEERVYTNPAGDEERVWTYPLTETLQVVGADIEIVPCA